MNEPTFSVGEATTPRLSFEECLVSYREAGVDAIGIVDGQHGERRGEDQDDLRNFKESGLKAGFCIPATVSILPRPLLQGSIPGSDSPHERVEAILASIRRLAAFEPLFCICLPGPVGDYEPARARDIAVNGLKRVARAAADVGVKIGIEPLHRSLATQFTFLTDLPDAAKLIAEIDEPNVGIVFDVWHHWDVPDVVEQIHAYCDRFVGVHVNDVREPTRSWCDRMLPGDGQIDYPKILGALNDAGYGGWYELEVLSDDGRNGNDFPDSLWKEEPIHLMRRARKQFMELWATSHSQTTPIR